MDDLLDVGPPSVREMNPRDQIPEGRGVSVCEESHANHGQRTQHKDDEVPDQTGESVKAKVRGAVHDDDPENQTKGEDGGQGAGRQWLFFLFFWILSFRFIVIIVGRYGNRGLK